MFLGTNIETWRTGGKDRNQKSRLLKVKSYTHGDPSQASHFKVGSSLSFKNLDVSEKIS